MRKYLLPQKNTYKANLHAHSLGSDGEMPPEVMRDEYKKRGYSVLSITEHERLIDYTYLDQDDFIFINGYEMSINEQADGDWDENKCCHLNLYTKNPHDTRQVHFHPQDIWYTDGVGETIEYFGEADDKKDYTAECINQIIVDAKSHDFIVCLNHPCWSLQTAQDVAQYDGLYAMEVFNTDNVYNGFSEYNLAMYESMVRAGKRIAMQMADDNHNHSKSDVFGGSFGGYDMIRADSLEYSSIINALEKGDFYCSQGPEIKDVYVQDGKVHITCSDAKEIYLATGIRRGRAVRAKDGEYINSASFDIVDKMRYIRLEVVDENQKSAYTRAYFTDEWQ